MLKTKLFTGYYTAGKLSERRFIDVDEEINDFLAKQNVEMVDIKYTVHLDSDGNPWNNALMIYKEII